MPLQESCSKKKKPLYAPCDFCAGIYRTHCPIATWTSMSPPVMAIIFKCSRQYGLNSWIHSWMSHACVDEITIALCKGHALGLKSATVLCCDILSWPYEPSCTHIVMLHMGKLCNSSLEWWRLIWWCLIGSVLGHSVAIVANAAQDLGWRVYVLSYSRMLICVFSLCRVIPVIQIRCDRSFCWSHATHGPSHSQQHGPLLVGSCCCWRFPLPACRVGANTLRQWPM